MSLSDIKEWLKHPVTLELFASLCTLFTVVALERHEARIYRLEAESRERSAHERIFRG